MPKIKTIRTKKSPEGWELIEPTITEIGNQIRDVENQAYSDKKKPEQFWEIYKLHHQRSRYIYEMYYYKKEISRELYEYCLQEQYGDASLIAKWKKTGYEKLCCLHCISKSQHNFGGTCICRVPKAKLEEGKLVQCKQCGCRGCASGD
ncbi:unnamed protein product [Paramecium sonneborni]|uniref:G10 protein n=1 Tax=Paramecium sonneborni TaxID=65129 RepID=A0A8S1MJ01_9CILI|nr:unnamed protein product [Paramecium sonneborni]